MGWEASEVNQSSWRREGWRGSVSPLPPPLPRYSMLGSPSICCPRADFKQPPPSFPTLSTPLNQHAFQCDGCDKSQHRTCNFFFSREQYLDIVNEDYELPIWYCSHVQFLTVTTVMISLLGLSLLFYLLHNLLQKVQLLSI